MTEKEKPKGKGKEILREEVVKFIDENRKIIIRRAKERIQDEAKKL